MSEPCPHCKSPNCRAFGRGHNAEPDDVTVCRLRNEREDLRGGLELAESRIATLESELTATRQRAEAAERQLKALDLLCGFASETESQVTFYVLDNGLRRVEVGSIWTNGDSAGSAALILAAGHGLIGADAKQPGERT